MSEYLTAEERSARVAAAYRAMAGLTRPALVELIAAALRDHEAGLYALALADGPGDPPVSATREAEVIEWARAFDDPVGWEARCIVSLLALLDHRTAELDHALARLALLYKDGDVSRAEIDRAERRGYRKGRAACVRAAASKAEDLWDDNKPAGLAVLTAVEAVPEED